MADPLSRAQITTLELFFTIRTEEGRLLTPLGLFMCRDFLKKKEAAIKVLQLLVLKF